MVLRSASIASARSRRHETSIALLVLAMVLLSVPHAQSPSAPQLPMVRTGTTAVVLDVVVRDRRGHPVRDIQQSELMVLEDGAPREVRSFRFIERSAPSAIAQSAPGSDQPDALRYPTLITFVFDHLTQNGRALARRAAIQFVSRELAANQWVAVYGLEQRLRLAQPFSRDAPELRSAIERATMVSAESHDRLTVERTDPEASERAASSAIAAAGSGGNAALGAAISEVVVRDVLAHMEHLVEASESQQRGQSTLFPLMALMKAQGV